MQYAQRHTKLTASLQSTDASKESSSDVKAVFHWISTPETDGVQNVSPLHHAKDLD